MNEAKFFDGEIVTTTELHFSQHEVVQLISPKCVNNEWFYGTAYCSYKNDRITLGGGSSYSWAEKDFRKIIDTKLKLACEVFYRRQEMNKLIFRLKIIKEELLNISFAKKLLA